MIRVEQTRLGGDIGNCFEASLASILECSVDEIPAWIPEGWDDYVPQLRAWLAELGLTVWACPVTPEPVPLSQFDSPPGALYIAGVVSTSPTWNHALVARDGAVVWDPAPGRDHPEGGLVGGRDPHVDWVFLLIPLDPARFDLKAAA